MDTPKPIILAVDDEPDMLGTYRSILKKKYSIIAASSGKEAIKICQVEPLSLVLLDIRMPKMDGIQVLKRIKEYDPNLEVIMVTASKDITPAVEAMKLGALDYITKPFDVKGLLALIQKALDKRTLLRENLYLRESLKEVTSYYDLIGKTNKMQNLYQTIDRVGPTDSTVLISGESGTGKELVARAIHKKSKRADKPFIAVNCAAIPENLFESDLFGHERGAFTGALERKLGKFELADGGTLFLDEIGCMPPAMQAKLLRILEDRVIERVGGEKGIPIDVRIISATNIDFEKHIEKGKFRQDLYYRLKVIPLTLVPLRERKEDIPLFVEYFLNKFNTVLNRKVSGFSQEAMQQLLAYHWPGNVRELQNLIERIVVLARSEIIPKEDIPLEIGTSQETASRKNLKTMVDTFEKDVIESALARNTGNLSEVARDLKTARSSLVARMKSLGIN